MDTIQVTLPDGSTQQVPRGITPAEIARKISPRLAEEALVASISSPSNGDATLVDLKRPLEQDAKMHLLTQQAPAALDVFRHSAAHLLAAAELERGPKVKRGIGPPIDYGVFDEFRRDEP